MTQRCCSPSHPYYDDYGGRGIKVCERWMGEGGFVNFLADVGERPEGMTLDREEVDGDYEPGNCRWATKYEQRWNRRDMAMRLQQESFWDDEGRLEDATVEDESRDETEDEVPF